MKIFTYILFCLILCPIGCQTNHGKNVHPSYNLDDPRRMVVQIVGKKNNRTGFIIGNDRNTIYILTAPHPTDKENKLIPDQDVEIRFMGRTSNVRGKLMREVDGNDIGIIEAEGSITTPINIPYYLDLSDKELDSSTKVSILGFPEASNNITRVVPAPSSITGNKWEFTGTQLTPGMSGSPVILEDTGEIVGMVTATGEVGKIIVVPKHLINSYLKSMPVGKDLILQQQRNKKIKIEASQEQLSPRLPPVKTDKNPKEKPMEIEIPPNPEGDKNSAIMVNHPQTQSTTGHIPIIEYIQRNDSPIGELPNCPEDEMKTLIAMAIKILNSNSSNKEKCGLLLDFQAKLSSLSRLDKKHADVVKVLTFMKQCHY